LLHIYIYFTVFSTNSNSKNSTPEPENCVNENYQPEKEENLDLDERIPLQPPMATVVSTIGELQCGLWQFDVV
jgi:hypothetical protein